MESNQNGKLYIYEPGTTTEKATYSDPALIQAKTNPVILDSTSIEASDRCLEEKNNVTK